MCWHQQKIVCFNQLSSICTIKNYQDCALDLTVIASFIRPECNYSELLSMILLLLGFMCLFTFTKSHLDNNHKSIFLTSFFRTILFHSTYHIFCAPFRHYSRQIDYQTRLLMRDIKKRKKNYLPHFALPKALLRRVLRGLHRFFRGYFKVAWKNPKPQFPLGRNPF